MKLDMSQARQTSYGILYVMGDLYMNYQEICLHSSFDNFREHF